MMRCSYCREDLFDARGERFCRCDWRELYVFWAALIAGVVLLAAVVLR